MPQKAVINSQNVSAQNAQLSGIEKMHVEVKNVIKKAVQKVNHVKPGVKFQVSNRYLKPRNANSVHPIKKSSKI